MHSDPVSGKILTTGDDRGGWFVGHWDPGCILIVRYRKVVFTFGVVAGRVVLLPGNARIHAVSNLLAEVALFLRLLVAVGQSGVAVVGLISVGRVEVFLLQVPVD